MDVHDRLNRPLRDLRISVTDRCNFRCTYCMPKEVFGRDYVFLPREAILTFEEITHIARISVANGVRKIRLTGGEPLLRRDLEQLVGMLARIEGLEDLALTTNGSLLSRERALALKDAGLQRITISLDSLDDSRFRSLNDVDFPVAKVLEAISAADEAGLTPVKVDMVVKRGVNDHDVVAMAEHFRHSGAVLRFIEYMDVGTTNGWRLDDVFSAREILDRISARWPVEPVAAAYRGEVAERYRYKDGAGEFGIIASVSLPFCGDCTRLRLSADGQLYTCLFGAAKHDLRSLLRGGGSDAELEAFLRRVWGNRSDRYSELRSEDTIPLTRVEMSHIGG